MSGRIPSGTVVDRPIVRQWLFFAALCGSVIAYGSVYPVPQYISSIGLVTICSLSLSRPVSAFVRNIVHFALFLLFILVAISLYQIIPLHNSTQIHESWSLLSEHFPGTEGTVAAAPALTLFSLPQLITPFSVFISALLLFAGDTEAARFWRWLSIFGICIALVGIVQFELTPDQMLFAKKIYYKDSVTGVFINRNTSATFFGIGALLWLGLILKDFHHLGVNGLVRVLFGEFAYHQKRLRRTAFHILGFMTMLTALGMTKSRGGLGATVIAIVCCIVLISWTAHKHRWLALLVAMPGLSVIIYIISSLAVQRAEMEGPDGQRLCTYQSVVKAIGEHVYLGSGFGNFVNVFPPYRNPECGTAFVWDRAHNVFLEGMLGFGVMFIPVIFGGIGVLLWMFIRAVRVRDQAKFAPLIGLSILILLIIHSMLDFSLQIPGFTHFAAATLACCTSFCTISLRRSVSFRKNTSNTAPPKSLAPLQKLKHDTQ